MTEIHTKRLILRSWDDLSHLTTMVGWLKDPEVVRYSEQRHRDHDEESQELYICEEVDIFREIYVDEQFIGTISAYIDKPNSVADVGILIGNKSVWGKGYGTEAWAAFCDSLFETGIRKIEAGCMVINIPMKAIFRKYGMFQEGIREQHFHTEKDGVYALIGMSLWGKFNEAV